MNPIVAFTWWLARSPLRAFLVIFLIGFSLRVWMLSLIPPDLIPPNPKWETGAVALSLLQTGQFADPYLIPTGPTAHMPPLQVGLFALLYRAAGYSYLGGLIRWLLVSAAHATVFALLPWLGGRMGMGREAGVLGGLFGAFSPHWPFELESFSALALALLMVAFLLRWEKEKEKEGSGWGSLLLGLGAGVSFHLQPALLPVVLACLAFESWERKDPRAMGRASLVALGIIVACIPWGWRNYRALGEAYFVRSNLGLELYVGNHEGAHGDIDVSDARNSFRHPRTDLAEAEEVREVGEAEYMRRKKGEALAWISANPGQFVELTASRVAFFWGGPLHRFPAGAGQLLLTLLALFGASLVLPTLTKNQRALVLIPLLTYPLIYYLVAYMPRYGYPVRWILFLLAGGAGWKWVGGELPGAKKGAFPAE